MAENNVLIPFPGWSQARRVKNGAGRKAFKSIRAISIESLNNRLDVLVVQFKESQPAFFNAYTTARAIVTSPGGRTSKDAVVTPIAKAA